jgi:uncharacterized protein with PQ loop repeat
MVQDSHGLHHFHRRKRIHQNHEPYPHPDKWKNFLDKIIYFVGILGPLMTIPQVWNIWVLKNASGVSILSWSTYLFVAIVWVLYGIVHKEKPIIVTYAIWIILDILIILGIILHG